MTELWKFFLFLNLPVRRGGRQQLHASAATRGRSAVQIVGGTRLPHRQGLRAKARREFGVRRRHARHTKGDAGRRRAMATEESRLPADAGARLPASVPLPGGEEHQRGQEQRQKRRERRLRPGQRQDQSVLHRELAASSLREHPLHPGLSRVHRHLADPLHQLTTSKRTSIKVALLVLLADPRRELLHLHRTHHGPRRDGDHHRGHQRLHLRRLRHGIVGAQSQLHRRRLFIPFHAAAADARVSSHQLQRPLPVLESPPADDAEWLGDWRTV